LCFALGQGLIGVLIEIILDGVDTIAVVLGVDDADNGGTAITMRWLDVLSVALGQGLAVLSVPGDMQNAVCGVKEPWRLCAAGVAQPANCRDALEFELATGLPLAAAMEAELPPQVPRGGTATFVKAKGDPRCGITGRRGGDCAQ